MLYVALSQALIHKPGKLHCTELSQTHIRNIKPVGTFNIIQLMLMMLQLYSMLLRQDIIDEKIKD